jgi:hypothetical protein
MSFGESNASELIGLHAERLQFICWHHAPPPYP